MRRRNSRRRRSSKNRSESWRKAPEGAKNIRTIIVNVTTLSNLSIKLGNELGKRVKRNKTKMYNF